MLVQLHCLQGDEDGPGLGTYARPSQLRMGLGALQRPGSFFRGGGGERREEVSSAPSPGACRVASTLTLPRPLEGSVCDPQKSPDTPGSPEGNTEGPGTASSE